MTTKPDTEIVWTKEWPAINGYYWRRINEHDYPSLVRIIGDTCRFSDGSSEGRYECYEFSGPLTPSDFEQLIRLRKQTEEAQDVIEGLLEFSDNVIEAFEIRPLPAHRACFNRARALIEALAYTGEQS